MAIAFVQESSLESVVAGSSLIFSIGSNITAGNLVMVLVTYYDGDNDIVTATAGGQSATYSYDIGVFDGQRFFVHIYENATGGSSTINLSSDGTSYFYAAAIEFSGLASSSVVDVLTAVSTGDSTNPSSPSTGVLSQADNLVVSWTGARITNDPSLYVAPSGWTLSEMNVQDWNNISTGGMAYVITASTASITPLWLGSPSTPNTWRCRSLVLKAAGAGPVITDNTNMFMGINF